MRKKARIDPWGMYEAEREALGEDNDCTVVSLAYALRITYEDAHQIMGKSGREGRSHGSMIAASRVVGEGILKEVEGLPYPYITLSEFCKTHSIGRYWAGVTDHALVVENGRACDHSDKVRRRVDMAWQVYNKTKEEPKDGEETCK